MNLEKVVYGLPKSGQMSEIIVDCLMWMAFGFVIVGLILPFV